MRPSGRAPNELRDVTIELGANCHAEGSCLIRFGDPRALHGHGRGAGPSLPPEHRQGLGHGGVRHAAPLHGLAQPARGGARQAVRPHPGDPAADRPLAPRRDRARHAGRAAGDPRLRRAAGRRRHAHGLDHRRLCGAASGPGPHRRRGRPAAPAPARAGGGRVLRPGRRKCCARSRLCGGQHRRGRRELRPRRLGGIVEIQLTAEQAPLGVDDVRELERLAAIGIAELVALQRAALAGLEGA